MIRQFSSPGVQLYATNENVTIEGSANKINNILNLIGLFVQGLECEITLSEFKSLIQEAQTRLRIVDVMGMDDAEIEAYAQDFVREQKTSIYAVTLPLVLPIDGCGDKAILVPIFMDFFVMN